ncbi:MAG: tetratricopeptide repeat protein [Polyangiales bacterium]
MRRTRAGIIGLGLLAACGGGTGEQAPPASAADARLAQTETSTPEASALVRQGEAKLAQNDASGARELFAQALTQNAQDSRAALDLGIASELLGDAGAAEKAYRQALAAKPDLTQAQNNLGVLLRDTGRLEEAVGMLERAVAAAPESAAGHQNLALAYEDAGKLDRSRAEYARAIDLAPDDAMTRANYGLLLLKLGDSQAAVRELSRARESAQGNRAALLAIGNGLRRAGAAKEALAAMEGALAAPGEAVTPALLSELALAQRAAGQRDEAVQTLRKVLAQDESYATAHYLLANMLASDSKFGEAKQHYERYLKLAPAGEHAQRARERLTVIGKRR